MAFYAQGFFRLFKQNPKFYIPRTIKTQMNLVLPDWAVRVVLKIIAVSLKYPTFQVVLFHILIGKQIQT